MRQRSRPAGAAAWRAERPTRVTGTIRPDPGSSWSARRPPARLGGGYAGESSADAERPAQEEAATEIDEIIVTGQRDYLYRADQSDALGTSIPLAELPATVNVITEDFLEDTRAYDIEDV